MLCCIIVVAIAVVPVLDLLVVGVILDLGSYGGGAYGGRRRPAY